MRCELIRVSFCYIALWVNDAILQIGISVIEPSQPPQAGPGLQLQPPMGPVQQLPSGQEGGNPMDVISLTTDGSTATNTPVKPEPDKPPLVVKIVTVLPIYLTRLSNKKSTLSTPFEKSQAE